MSETDPKTAYLAAAERLMHELASGGLRMGLSYAMLESALRDATLEAAFRQFERSGSKITTSSLHVATGIHRREVSRWLSERSDAAGGATSPVARASHDSPSARVVARWSTHESYQHADGRPIPLPLSMRSEGGQSFAGLVEEIGPEVRAKSVLEGLIAAGLVEALQDGSFQLTAAAYLPEANSTESIGFLAANVGDHLSAAVHNISAAPEDRFFERAMFSPSVSSTQAAALREAIAAKGMSLLQDMAALAAAEEDTGADPRGDAAGQRVRIGVYFYQDEADE